MRLGSAAVAWAIARRKARTDVGVGYCLRFVRRSFGIPAKYGSARVAWSHTAKEDRHSGAEPPPGVPVFWAIGTNWHVAVSDGGGWVESTDILEHGKVSRVRISTITKRWGARYLGWAETLNGVRVYDRSAAAAPKVRLHVSHLIAAAHHDPHAAAKDALHPDQVKVVEKVLVRAGLLDDRWLDGSWGTKTVRAWAAWQRRLGLHGADADGIPGTYSVTKFAEKYHLEVAA